MRKTHPPSKTTTATKTPARAPRPAPEKPETRGAPVGLRKTDYTGSERYPDGTVRLLSNATSPWQKLIESRRIELQLSLRAVANLTKQGGGGGISFNLLWNWLRHTDGYPSPRSYTPALNVKLARALDLPAQQLADAYAASRAAHGLAGRDSSESKVEFILSLLAGDPRDTFTKAEVIALFESLR